MIDSMKLTNGLLDSSLADDVLGELDIEAVSARQIVRSYGTTSINMYSTYT